MFGLEIVIRVAKRNRHEFLQAMEFMRHRDAAGTECRLFEEIGDSERLLWVERWNDNKALEANLHTEGFRTLLGAIKVLGDL
jgi:quinol monooxygenase YgiN